MKKIKFSSTWLYVLAIPFEITAIILFAGKGSNTLGSVFLCVGMALYAVGIFLSRKERKAEERVNKSVEENAAAEQEESKEIEEKAE